ncbi:MAG: hypothetical protein HC811_02010 [Flammeovirgaceae bacterium]|nr:hypothetical protein [Flammeovirgaceae bacterium]
MDKTKFHNLLENFAALNADEANELIQLTNKFPYSQVVRNLATKASKDNDLKSSDDQLHMSAVYATDRSVLKRIVTHPRSTRKEIKKVVTAQEVPPPQKIVTAQTNKTGGALVKELMSDLNKLQKLKKQFLNSVEEFEKKGTSQPEKTEKREEIGVPSKSESSKLSNVAKAKGAVTKTISKKKPAKKVKKKATKPFATENLIDEISKKKKELPVEGPKQKEQQEIIDNFMKNKPNLKKGIKTEGPNMPDLAENSVFYSDQVVSETLVTILINQGKKEKAVEMLKKLIWKYPQKKAYFAARIEELKN